MPENTPSNRTNRDSSDSSWSAERKRLATVAIALHLAAIAVAPLSTPPPASQLSETVAFVFRPYLLATHLNHGYRFFAPNPGPSHIVRYEVEGEGGAVKQGQLPDPAANWPRLLYHRHFMMTETIFNNWTLIERVPEDVQLTEEQQQQLTAQNNFPERLVREHAQGMARRLLDRYGGETVRLTLVEHQIPYPPDVTNGQKLDDETLYVTVGELGVFNREGLLALSSEPEELP